MQTGGRLSWGRLLPPAMLPPFTCPGRGWSACVSQLLVNTPSFKPVSAFVFAHLSHPPLGLGLAGVAGGTLVLLGETPKVGIGMGGLFSTRHLPMAQVRGSPVTPPSVRRDVEIQKAFSVMFYF